MRSVVILLSTFPEIKAARLAVRTLVEERLIACGNILPGVESIYRWKGAVETSTEVIVFRACHAHSLKRFASKRATKASQASQTNNEWHFMGNSFLFFA
jgi:uncharacterized protein involved in tolerance to divalent cations